MAPRGLCINSWHDLWRKLPGCVLRSLHMDHHSTAAGSELQEANATLGAEIERIWSLFTRGAVDKRSAFNIPTVATIGVDGAPALRTVVLRTCSPSDRSLTFHTDARSRKTAELTANPTIVWHVWSQRQRLQVRARAKVRLHSNDEVAARAWDRLHAGSRSLYTQATPPLTRLSTAEDVRNQPPLDDNDGFTNFVVAETTVSELEWLELAQEGHRRGLGQWDARGNHWLASWIAP